MAEESEKTEPATPRKRQRVREEGNVATSREIPNAAILGTALLVFVMAGGWMWGHLVDMFLSPIQMIGRYEVTMETIRPLTGMVAGKMLLFLLPVVIGVLVAGVGANVGQVGFLFAREAMVPKPNRLNPVSGLKNMFSIKSVFEAIKNTFKIILFSYVAWTVIDDEVETLISLELSEYHAVFFYMLSLISRITFRSVLVMIVLGIIDYAYQRYEWERKNRMTKQEVKDEFKQMEGDPKVKARVRSIQREIAMRRMMAEVPKADVVITNPTEYAVALKYESGQDFAPRVVAKGQGHVAMKIRKAAAKAGVPILERKALARELYRMVKIGREIPGRLYQAVAEILAYVYSLKEKRSTANG